MIVKLLISSLMICVVVQAHARNVVNRELPHPNNIVWTAPKNLPEGFEVGENMFIVRDGKPIEILSLTNVNDRLEFAGKSFVEAKGAFAAVVPDYYLAENENQEPFIRINLGSYEVRLPDYIIAAGKTFSAPVMAFPKHSYSENYIMPWAFLRLVGFPAGVVKIKSDTAPLAGWFSFDGLAVFPADELRNEIEVDFTLNSSNEIYIPILADTEYNIAIGNTVALDGVNLPAGEVKDIIYKSPGGNFDPPVYNPDEDSKDNNHSEYSEDNNPDGNTSDKTETPAVADESAQEPSSGKGYDKQQFEKWEREKKNKLDESRKERLTRWIAERDSFRKSSATITYSNRLKIDELAKNIWESINSYLPDNGYRSISVDVFTVEKSFNGQFPEFPDWSDIYKSPKYVAFPRFGLLFDNNLRPTYFANSYRDIIKEPFTSILPQNDPRTLKHGKPELYVSVKKADKNLEYEIDGCDSLKVLSLWRTPVTKLTIRNCGQLRKIILFGNQLETLTVQNCPALEYIDVSINRLDSLGIKKCPNIYHLQAPNNQLRNIDVSNLPKLEYLDVSFNDLTALDVSKNSRLRFLLCVYNLIKKLDISKLYYLECLSCTANDHLILKVKHPGEFLPEMPDEISESYYSFPWLWQWHVNGKYKKVYKKRIKKVNNDPYDWARLHNAPPVISSS
ncbi:MAG: hypothetical protein K2L92_08905, partial [Muribaculaceae bacterium]|nr:hypothetical protein [Muribaculaceae bacterium]